MQRTAFRKPACLGCLILFDKSLFPWCPLFTPVCSNKARLLRKAYREGKKKKGGARRRSVRLRAGGGGARRGAGPERAAGPKLRGASGTPGSSPARASAA